MEFLENTARRPASFPDHKQTHAHPVCCPYYNSNRLGGLLAVQNDADAYPSTHGADQRRQADRYEERAGDREEVFREESREVNRERCFRYGAGLLSSPVREN